MDDTRALFDYRSLMRLTKSLTALLPAVALSFGLAGCGSNSGGAEVIGSDTVSTEDSSSEGDTTAEAPAADAQEFEVESGFTSGTDSIDTLYTSAGALLTNPNQDLASYGAQVVFNIVGADGEVLDTATETVNYIGPGETVPVAPLQIGFDIAQEPADLEVQVVGEFSVDEGPKGSFSDAMSILTVKSAEVGKSDYGREVNAQVTNDTDEVVTNATWDCVYLKGKKIVGGASSAIIDPITPGSTVQFSEYISIAELPVKTVNCRVVSSF